MRLFGLCSGVLVLLVFDTCLARPFASEVDQLADEVERLMTDVKRSVDADDDAEEVGAQERDEIPAKVANTTAAEGSLAKEAATTDESSTSPSNATIVSASSNSQSAGTVKASDMNGIPDAVKDDLNAKVRDGERLTSEQGAPVPTSAELKAKEKDSDKSAEAKSTEPASKTIEKSVSEAVESDSKHSDDKDGAVQSEIGKIQSSEAPEKVDESKAKAKSDVEDATVEKSVEQQTESESQEANSKETSSVQDASVTETAADEDENSKKNADDSQHEKKSAEQHESSSDQDASAENSSADESESAAADGAAQIERDEDKVKMFFISPFEAGSEDEAPLGTQEAQSRQILTYPASGHGWGHSHQWGPSHIWNSDYPYFAYGYSWGCGHHGYGPHHSLKKSGVGRTKNSDTVCRDYVLIPAAPRASVVAPRNGDVDDASETGTVRQVVSKDVACNDDDPQCAARQVIGSMAGGSMFGDGMGGLGIGFPGIPGIHTGVSGYNEAGGFGDHMHGHHGHGGYGIGDGGYGHHGGYGGGGYGGGGYGGGGYGGGGYSRFFGGNDRGFPSFWGNRGFIPEMDKKEESPEKKTKVKKGSKVERRFLGGWGLGGFGVYKPGSWGSGGLSASFNAPMFQSARPAQIAGPLRVDTGVGGAAWPGLNFDGFPGWGSFGHNNWGSNFGGFGRNFRGPVLSPAYGSVYDYGVGEGIGRPFLDDSSSLGGYDGGFGAADIGYADYPGILGGISHGGFHSSLTYKSKIKRKHEGKKKENEVAKISGATARQDIAMPDEQALMDVTKQRQLIGALGASTLFGDNVGGMGLGHPGVPQMSSGVSGIPGEYGGSGGYSHGWEGHGPGMHPHGYSDYGYNFGHEDGDHEEGYSKSTTPIGEAEEQGQKKQLVFPGSAPYGGELATSHVLSGHTYAARHGGHNIVAGTHAAHFVASHHSPVVPVTVPYSGYTVGPWQNDAALDGDSFGDDYNHDDGHIIGPIGVVDHHGYGNVYGPIGQVEHHEIHHEAGDHYGGQLIHESHQLASIAPSHDAYYPLEPKHVHVGVGTPNVKVEVETDKSKIGKPLSHVTAQKMSEIKKLVKDVSNSIKKTGEKLKAMKKGRVASNQEGKRQITPAFTPVTAEPAGVPDIRYPVPAADRYPLGAGYIWPSANYGHQYGGPYAWSKSHTPSGKKHKPSKNHKKQKAHKKGKRSAVAEVTRQESDNMKKVSEKKVATKRQLVSRNEMFEHGAGYPYHGGMAIYGYGMGYPLHGAGAGAAYGGYAGHGSYGMEGYGVHGIGGHGFTGYGAYGTYGHGFGGHGDGLHYLGSFGHGDIDHGVYDHGGYLGGHGGLGDGYGHEGVMDHGFGGYEGHHAYGGYVGHGGAYLSGYEGHGIASAPVGGLGGIGGYGHGFEAIHGGDIPDHVLHGGFSRFGEFGPFSGDHSPLPESHAASGLRYVGGIGGYGGMGAVGGLGGVAALGGHEVAYQGYGLGGHTGYGNGYGFARQDIENHPQGEGGPDESMAAMSRSQMPEEPMMGPQNPQSEFAPESMIPRFAGYPGSKKSDVPKARNDSKADKLSSIKGKA